MTRRLKRGGWPYPQPPNVPFELNKDSPQVKGLMGWWPMLGSRGANVLRDFSGHGNDGAFKGIGEPAWVTDGERGSALDFDGADDYVDIAHSAELNIGTGGYALSAWIYPHNLGTDTFYDQIIFLKYQDINNRFYFQFRKANWFQFGAGVGGEFYYSDDSSLTPGFSENQWQHLLVVIDRTTDLIYVYRNGVLVGTGDAIDAEGIDISNTGYARIGMAWYEAIQFDGLIADVRTYNRTLSAAEAYQLYAPQTRWELYRPLIPFFVVKSPVVVAIPRYPAVVFQCPAIV